MALKRLIFLVFLFVLQYFAYVVEYISCNCFIKHFKAAVNVLFGPCCPALLTCIDVDVHTRTVVLLSK